MNKRTLILASFFYALLNFPAQANTEKCNSSHYDQKVTVKNVIDGDTVELSDGRHVRFIGINTPENKYKNKPAEPFAGAITDWLRKTIGENEARLFLRFGEDQQDHYGRILAHPFLPDGKNLTALLLQQGKGIRVGVPPNLDFQDCYFSAEADAQIHKLGLWNIDYFNVRQASTLSKKETGFRRIQGRVSRIGESRRAYWLNLGKGFAIRLPKDKLKYFNTTPYDFNDKLITLRGWVYYVDKRSELRVNLYHPNMIETIQSE